MDDKRKEAALRNLEKARQAKANKRNTETQKPEVKPIETQYTRQDPLFIDDNDTEISSIEDMSEEIDPPPKQKSKKDDVTFTTRQYKPSEKAKKRKREEMNSRVSNKKTRQTIADEDANTETEPSGWKDMVSNNYGVKLFASTVIGIFFTFAASFLSASTTPSLPIAPSALGTPPPQPNRNNLPNAEPPVTSFIQ